MIVYYSKKEGIKNIRPGVPPPPGPTPLVPSASLEAEDDMGVYILVYVYIEHNLFTCVSCVLCFCAQ